MSDKSKKSVSVKEESSSFRSQTKSAKVTSSSSIEGHHTSTTASEKRISSKTQRSVQSFEDFVFRPTISSGNAISLGSDFEDVSKQICHVNDGDTFEMKLDVQEYKPDEVQVKITDNLVTITGKQEERKDEKNFRSRQFSKKFTIPAGVRVENISCTMTTQGTLKISAPIEQQGRPGLSHRQIQEIRQESANSSRKSSLSSDISSVSQTQHTMQHSSKFEDELVLHPKVNSTTVRKSDSKDVTREISTKNDGKNFEMKLEIKNFKSEEIDIRITKTLIKIEGKHEDKFSSRSFYKEFTIPHGVRTNTIQCDLDDELGILTITAPIQQTQPSTPPSSIRSTQDEQLEAVTSTTQQQKQVTSAHKTVKKQLQHYERTDSASSVTSSVSSVQESRRFEDDVIVRPIIDRSISKDMISNFEDVSKQLCRVDEGRIFEVKIEVVEYKPEELVVKITDNMVSIEGKHEIKEENKFAMRQFSKKFTIPEGVKPETITSTLSNKGILKISAPIETTVRNQDAITESTRETSNIKKTQHQTVQQQHSHVTHQQSVEKQEQRVVQQQEQQRVVQQQEQRRVVQQQQHDLQQELQQSVEQQEHQQRLTEQEQTHAVKQQKEKVVQQEEHVVQQDRQRVVSNEQQTKQPGVPNEPKPEAQPQQQPMVQQETPKVPAEQEPAVQNESPKVPAEQPVVQEETPKVPVEQQPAVESESPKVLVEQPVVPQEAPKLSPEQPAVQQETPKVPAEQQPAVQQEAPKVAAEQQPAVQQEAPKVPAEQQPAVQQETPIAAPAPLEQQSIAQPEEPVLQQEVPVAPLEQQPVVQQEAPTVPVEQQPLLQPEQQPVAQQVQPVTQPEQHVVQEEQQRVVQQEEQTVSVAKQQEVISNTAQQQELIQQKHEPHKLTALNIAKHQQQITEISEEESFIQPIIEPQSPSVSDVRFEDVSKQICRVSDGKIFEMKFDVPEYKPTDIQITISEGMVTIEGKQETENTSRSFFKKFTIPQGVKPAEIKNKFSPKGVLTISAPIHSNQPDQQHQIQESESLSSIASTTSTVTEAVRKVGENYFLRPTMSNVSVLEDSRFEDVSKEVTRVNEGKTFETKLNVPEYKPEELQVKITDNMVTIEGKQETANSSRSFFKKFTIPQGVKPEDITSSLNPQGVLTISAPIHATQPALLPNQPQTNTTTTSDEQVATKTTNVRKLQEQAVQQISQSDSLNSISSITSSVNESVRKVGENYVLRPTMSVDSFAEDSRFEDVSKTIARVDEGKKFETTFNVPEYKPEELQVKITQNMVIIEGKQETTNSSRSFFKKFTIPHGVKPEDITSSLTPQGVLTISAPIQSTQTHDLQQQQHHTSTTKTQEVTSSQTRQQQQVTQQQQKVTESESVRRVGENYILRPRMGVDNVIAQDTRFEDVSKQVARLDEGRKFETKLDVPEYKPEELQVRISENMVTIEGKQETSNTSRSFFKKFTVPHGVKPEDITSSLSPQGVLTISAPIQTNQTQNLQQEQVNSSTSRTTKTEQAVSQTAVRKQEFQSVHQQSSVDSQSSRSVHDSTRQAIEDFIIRPTRGIDSLLEKDSRFEDVSKQFRRLDSDEQKKFEMKFDVPEYKPDELQVKISDNMVTIEGKQETANSSRSFFKKFSIPQGVKPENITSSLSSKGVLTISAIIETTVSSDSRNALSSSTTKHQSVTSSTNISSNVSSDRRNREVFLQPKLNFDSLLSTNALCEDVSKQISHSTDRKTFEVKLDVQEYKPEEIEVRISNNLVTIEGNQEIRQESSFKSRSFSKKFSIPEGVRPESIKCILSADGLLSLTAPVDTTNLALTETGSTSVSQHKQQQSREQRVQASSTTKKVSSSVSSTRTSSNF